MLPILIKRRSLENGPKKAKSYMKPGEHPIVPASMLSGRESPSENFVAPFMTPWLQAVSSTPRPMPPAAIITALLSSMGRDGGMSRPRQMAGCGKTGSNSASRGHDSCL